MTENPYEKMCDIGLTARADMLETVAGYDRERVHRELAFAVVALDYKDPDTMRWLACLMKRHITELQLEEAEERAKERATCSRCLARTYRQEECICPGDEESGADAEDYDEALSDEIRKLNIEERV